MADLTFGTDSHFALGIVFQKTLDTTAGELERRTVCQQHSISLDDCVRCGVRFFPCKVKGADSSGTGTRHECSAVVSVVQAASLSSLGILMIERAV